MRKFYFFQTKEKKLFDFETNGSNLDQLIFLPMEAWKRDEYEFFVFAEKESRRRRHRETRSFPENNLVAASNKKLIKKENGELPTDEGRAGRVQHSGEHQVAGRGQVQLPHAHGHRCPRRRHRRPRHRTRSSAAKRDRRDVGQSDRRRAAGLHLRLQQFRKLPSAGRRQTAHADQVSHFRKVE